jgi:membrane protease YdiL (CAAX protease family)
MRNDAVRDAMGVGDPVIEEADQATPVSSVAPARHVLAVCLSVIPLFLFAIWFHLTREVPLTIGQMMVYPLMIGGGAIVYMLLLLKYLCRERPRDLNLKPGRWYADVVAGIVLALIFGAILIAGEATLGRALPRPPSKDIGNLIQGLATSPLLLALWLGPVVGVGVAGFEELSRVFLLSRLWKVWGGPAGRWSAVLLFSALFGAVHVYQGAASAVSVGIMGVAGGAYYLRFGRVWPLIIAHGLYDSVTIATVIGAIRAAGG